MTELPDGPGCDAGIPADLTPATCPHEWDSDGIPTPPGQTGQWSHCTVCDTDYPDTPKETDDMATKPPKPPKPVAKMTAGELTEQMRAAQQVIADEIGIGAHTPHTPTSAAAHERGMAAGAELMRRRDEHQARQRARRTGQ